MQPPDSICNPAQSEFRFKVTISPTSTSSTSISLILTRRSSSVMATAPLRDSCVWLEQRCPPTQTSSSGLSKVVFIPSTPTLSPSAAITDDVAQFRVDDDLVPAGTVTTGGTGGIAIRVGQTVFITANTGTGSNKAVVTLVDYATSTFTVAFYEGCWSSYGYKYCMHRNDLRL